jgi:hypothetical protein
MWGRLLSSRRTAGLLAPAAGYSQRPTRQHELHGNSVALDFNQDVLARRALDRLRIQVASAEYSLSTVTDNAIARLQSGSLGR